MFLHVDTEVDCPYMLLTRSLHTAMVEMHVCDDV